MEFHKPRAQMLLIIFSIGSCSRLCCMCKSGPASFFEQVLQRVEYLDRRKMCLKLGNKRHCLTLLSILGGLQVLISLPIIALSFVVFFQTTLGAALSPFWCGFVVSTFELLVFSLFSFLHKYFNQPYTDRQVNDALINCTSF